jgi:hypothetical protein
MSSLRRRRTRLSILASPAAALVAALAAPRAASAYEHQFHLGGAFGYSSLQGEPSANGFSGRINFDYGLTDAVNLMTRVEFADYPSLGLTIPSVAVGGGFVLDVLQFVPYIGAMVGVADAWVPKCAPTNPLPCNLAKMALEIPGGVDYLITRRFALGVVGRYQALVFNGGTNNMLSVSLKAEYIWGF